MTNLIVEYSLIFSTYTALFIFFALSGRSLILLTSYLFTKQFKIPNEIFNTKSSIFYPLFGYFIVGNLLVIFNFFVPLNSPIVILGCGILIILNLISFDINNLKLSLDLQKIVFHFLIPLILLVSTFDLNFHYDAAFYHLNHQNWLRESNIVIGMVNIFWPYGIGSINEYVSAIFWGKTSLVNIHYLSIIFLNVFFNFLFFHVRKSKYTPYTFPSVFILLFGFLDNFGFDGGRNGFLYIQELGKQDLQVSTLVILSSLIICNWIIKRQFDLIEVVLITYIILLSFQLKIGGITPAFLLIYFFIYSFRNNLLNIRNFLYSSIPAGFFFIIWTLKSYLVSGCIIFPVNTTCINNFSWYRDGSTKFIEEYTSQTSLAFHSYFADPQENIFTWFNYFFYQNEPFSSFYRSYYSNFFLSLFILFLIKKIFTTKKENYRSKEVLFYVLGSLLFLIMFGPIPRYTSGILTLSAALIGLNVLDFKKQLNINIYYFVFLLTLALVPRLNSYLSAIENQNIALPDPRFEWNYDENKLNDSWISPIGTDICWINLYCTSEVGGKILITDQFYKVVNRVID